MHLLEAGIVQNQGHIGGHRILRFAWIAFDVQKAAHDLHRGSPVITRSTLSATLVYAYTCSRTHTLSNSRTLELSNSITSLIYIQHAQKRYTATMVLVCSHPGWNSYTHKDSSDTYRRILFPLSDQEENGGHTTHLMPQKRIPTDLQFTHLILGITALHYVVRIVSVEVSSV
jgi:hypothetical protein